MWFLAWAVCCRWHCRSAQLIRDQALHCGVQVYLVKLLGA